MGLLISGCGSSTAPSRSSNQVPISVEATVVPAVYQSGATSEYLLGVRSTFRNVQPDTIFVHHVCDEPSNVLWVSLVRPDAVSARIAYRGSEACLLVAPVEGVALAPGDSLSSIVFFRATFNHPLTSSDSEAVAGPMRMQYVVTATAGPYMDQNNLIPDSLRVSPTFDVVLP